MNKWRTIVFYKSYFESFFKEQEDRVKKKIIWTLQLIEEVQHVPKTYFKHLEGTDGLYEIRIQLGNNIFRIFCFFDKEKLVVIMNGFQKKTQKIPKTEIQRALTIKKEYEQERK